MLLRSLVLALALTSTAFTPFGVRSESVAFFTPGTGVSREKSDTFRPDPEQVNDPCQRGYDLTYNLDFPEALAAFRLAVAAHPNDPQAYRGLATATWLAILFQRGVVTVDDYMGHVSTGDQKLDQPPAA